MPVSVIPWRKVCLSMQDSLIRRPSECEAFGRKMILAKIEQGLEVGIHQDPVVVHRDSAPSYSVCGGSSPG